MKRGPWASHGSIPWAAGRHILHGTSVAAAADMVSWMPAAVEPVRDQARRRRPQPPPADANVGETSLPCSRSPVR